MCGIYGELRLTNGGPPLYGNTSRMIALMSRRGPDDCGTWHDGTNCTLAFTRLSILDLSSAGHQPMTTRDQRHALVFNGELYNFRDLRRELVSHGIAFRSSGDAEVVLQSLVRWRSAALDRFNGMFALAFYDSVTKELLLARDHAGIKPLYYMLTRDSLVFASQYNQILEHPIGRTRRISRDGLSLYLRLGYVPAPFAILDNTHMLEPGTWLIADAGARVERGRFFEFPVYCEPDLEGPDAEEAIDAAVDSAVRRQMVSDVPIAAFLSGGIDSPLVASKMRAASTLAIDAYTIGTACDATDESADAAEYARELGANHILEQFSARDALLLLDDVMASSGEPFADYSIFPTMLVSRLAAERVKVMLSGDGGDELFWGYVHRFGSILRCARDFRNPLWLRNAKWGVRRLLHPASAPSIRHLRWPSIGDWHRAKHTHLPEHWARKIFPTLPEWPCEFKSYNFDEWDIDRTAQWLRWNEYTEHLTRVLLKVDRASMHHSLEVRVPLLDREVIDTARRVNWRSCLDLDRGVGKLPLRRALARHVRWQSRHKRGFSVPMGDWLRGALRPIVEDSLMSRRELLGLPLNQESLRELYQAHLRQHADYGWALWILLSLSLWCEKHYRQS